MAASAGTVLFEFEVDGDTRSASYETTCCSDTGSEFISYVHTQGEVTDSLSRIDATAELLESIIMVRWVLWL